MSQSPRTWLVTGSSRGFGRELCELLLERGERVVATARDPSAVDSLLQEHPGRALAVRMDVTDEASVVAAVQKAEDAFGSVDILVNNAGYVVVGAVEEVSVAHAQAVFDTNYFGAMRVIQAVLPGMRRRAKGHIVNVSAMGGMMSSGGLSAYCATKFAMEAMTESLAAEVAPFGIKVTSVLPGSFRTEAQSSAQIADLLPEYDATSGALARRFTAAAGTQPGNPRRAMEALVELAGLDEPPLRVALGNDAVQRIRKKLQEHASELNRWERFSTLES